MSEFKHVPHNILAFMRFFAYQHLPVPLQGRSKPFHDVALQVLHDCERQYTDDSLGNDAVAPDWAEVMVGLRNLLTAKDNIVRAFLPR